MERFPCDFLIGAATAAHQVEGNNIHSDAWAEEHMKHTTYLEPSGAALDHYHRYEEDIRMMAAAQPFISGAISKTVNMPQDVTVEDVEQLHIEAWKLGVKAIAIYRDNC